MRKIICSLDIEAIHNILMIFILILFTVVLMFDFFDNNKYNNENKNIEEIDEVLL